MSNHTSTSKNFDTHGQAHKTLHTAPHVR